MSTSQLSSIYALGPCPQTGIHSRDGGTGYYRGTQSGVMLRDERGNDLNHRDDLTFVTVGPSTYVVEKSWAAAWDAYDTQLHDEQDLWQEAQAACPLPHAQPQEVPPRRLIGSMGFAAWKTAYDAAVQANKQHQAYMAWCNDCVALAGEEL